MKKQIHVIVASVNPVKIKATVKGFQSYFEEVIIEGATVPSGVADQPMNDLETLTGARNRARSAQVECPDYDFWVGIEGGVERDENGLTAFAWVVIFNGKLTGEARTTTFRLPLKVSELIDQGYELGTANDLIFSEHNSKQKSGAVGLLTGDRIDRTQLYMQAVQLALIPFVNLELYDPTFR